MVRNGSYSRFYYSLPGVEMQPRASAGLSFSAAQPLGKHWGLFVRANTVWNSSEYIQSSIAGGAVYSNPLGAVHRSIRSAWGWPGTGSIGPSMATPT